jgi:N-acetylglucosamine-6-phosphate deacetylase
MIEAVRNLHALGVPLGDALAAGSTVPAGVLGALDVGRLAPGLAADIVVVDDNLQIERVLVGGQERVVA